MTGAFDPVVREHGSIGAKYSPFDSWVACGPAPAACRNWFLKGWVLEAGKTERTR